MVIISHEYFPPSKCRPPTGPIVARNLSDHRLLHSLLAISLEISSMQPIRFLLRRNTYLMIRRSKLVSILFEELLRSPVTAFPPTAELCFEELYIALQSIKGLIEDCRNSSKMWLLMRSEMISNRFHELSVELSTLLDIFPAKDLELGEDVEELICLVQKQSSEKEAYVDSGDEVLREDVLRMLDRIKREIVPDQENLAEIFNKLNLSDSTSCSDEIDCLEDEIQSQTDAKSKSDIVALISLVRYAKCVLYGASTPRRAQRRRKTAADVVAPADFRCPISLDLMRDPVVVSTGQTYDRPSISLWIESGHNTCPKTGTSLTSGELIPNVALKNTIAMWCREQRIAIELTDPNVKSHGAVTNKAALEATKMTVSFLVNQLRTWQSVEKANRLVHELRVLAKTDSDSRACIAELGALPLLVKLLGPENPSLQVNAVTAILNLSILEANKARIMEMDGVLNGVIEVLRSGSTWEAKGNAAATVFSLTGLSTHRKCLWSKTRVVRGLVNLAREGPTSSKRDAVVAILNLAGDKEAAGKLIEGGVVEMAGEVMDALPEEAATILEVVVKRGGVAAVAAAYPIIQKLTKLLREGTDRTRESAAATLVNMCRRGGSEIAAELAAVYGIERVIWELMGTGTGRGRRKAAALLRILRRWAAAGPNEDSNVSGTTRILLPGRVT
ncbi:unnamed protein product [Cuscuta epithymum]|uniref:RING-type E3 ubiquitin transferase n=1 Tax=Cuscuta epithymum TaxID=186058 RepID=A0AAV0DL14_9ASTE|nr:unnamed protein product [Cuscuta epithymum]